MSASLEGNVWSREFVAYPARPRCKCRKEATETRRVRDCGMKLTMDGKLSRKEVRKRRDGEREKRRKKLPKGK